MSTTTDGGAIMPSKSKIDLSKLPPLESAATFVKRNINPLQHIVKDIITEGVGILAAREKAGKSWFCYQLGACVANGKPFLGHQVQMGSVLYFDFENPEPVRQERLKLMFPDGTPENLFFISAPTETDPWIIGDGFEEVLSYYLEQKPDTKLVVIDVLDTIADDQKRSESPKRHAYRNIRALKAIAQKQHIAIICVMHFRKMVDPDDFLSNISGSNGWAAAADFAGGISKKRGEMDAVFQTDGRTCRGVELAITQEPETMRWKLQGTLEEQMERKRIEEFEANAITKAVVKAVEDNNGKWTGTSDALKGTTIFDQGEALPMTARAITAFIRGTTDLFYTVYGISIIDKNANNSKTSEWCITKMYG